MSREIKFRAWSDASGRMFPALTLKELCEKPYLYDGMDHMQYTGLTDKNGVEIYEGDVVQNGLRRGVIRWFAPTKPTYIIFTPKEEYDPGDWKGEHNDLDGRAGAFGYSGKIEVIGNIYANPELLEA